MNKPHSPRPPNQGPTAKDKHQEIDVLGGEYLEGSGFEEESSDPDFQTDHTRPTVSSTGGEQ